MYMSYILTKIFIIRWHLRSWGFTPINLMIFFFILRILGLILTFILRNDFNLEFISYLNSIVEFHNISLKLFNFFNLIFCFKNINSTVDLNLYQDINLYYAVDMKQCFVIEVYIPEIPYYSTLKEILNKVSPGVYWMENNTGKGSSSTDQNLSDIANQALARLNPNISDTARPRLPKLDLPSSSLNKLDLTKSDLPRPELARPPELARSHLHDLGLPRTRLPRMDLLGPRVRNIDVSRTNLSDINPSRSNVSNTNIPRPNLTIPRSDLERSHISTSNISTPIMSSSNIAPSNVSTVNLPSLNEENRLTFVDPNQSFDYLKTYTFTPDEFKRFRSLENKELIRAFDPAYLRKFSDTLLNEDFHKHLNSPTNHKFQNCLANNIRKRIDIVLNIHNGDYIEANDNMNKTMNDYKGRIWYQDKPMQYKKVKNYLDPIRAWD